MVTEDPCATCKHPWHGLPCQGNTHITNWPNLTCPCPGPYVTTPPDALEGNYTEETS